MQRVSKLVVNGHSTQVTIPRRMLARLGWKAGDYVITTLHQDGRLIVERATVAPATVPVDATSDDPAPAAAIDCPACADGECPLHLGTPSHLGAL